MKRKMLFFILSVFVMGCIKHSEGDKKKIYSLNDISGYSVIDGVNENDLVIKSLSEAGVDKKIIDQLHLRILNSPELNIHSFLLMKDGSLVFEKYYPNGINKYDPFNKRYEEKSGVNVPHRMQSVTKTVTGVLIGKLVDEGKINLEDSVVKYFEEFSIPDFNEKKAIKIKHLLSMSSGLENVDSFSRYWWDENHIQHILDKKLINSLGDKMFYNNGNSDLLAYIIEKITGKPIAIYADEVLFKPMGITNYRWEGKSRGCAGLFLRSRDMLKIGELIRNNGKYVSKIIVSSSWINQLKGKQINGNDGEFYGYQIWLFDWSVDGEIVEAQISMGWAIQRIVIIPKYKITFVITSGNDDYRGNEFYAQPVLLGRYLARDFVMPSIGINNLMLW